MRITLAGVAAATLFANPSFAQSTPAWTVTSGIEQFALRDIARSSPPVDGSPVAWSGSGPMVLVAHDRSSDTRTHRFEFLFANAGSFSYDSPLRSYAGDAGDQARVFEGRYEYRRLMLSSKLPSWVRASIGVRGSGSHLSLAHVVAPQLSVGYATTAGGAALVVAATFWPAQRLSMTANYTNGLLVGWLQPVNASSSSGGGWTTDLALTAAFRLTPRVALTGGYFNRGDTFLSSHRGLSTDQQQFSVGVTYAR